MALVVLVPGLLGAQGKNYPEDLLKGRNSIKVTDLKQFDKASQAVKEYLRTLSNGVKVPIRVENAYIFKGNDSLYVNFGRNVADYPIRPEGLRKIYELVKSNLPSGLRNKKLAIFAAGSKLEQLVTPFYNQGGRYAKIQKDGVIKVSSSENRLKEQENKPYAITRGLQDRHIAMQNSHGWYYEPSLDRWEFQRARLFGVVEDTYTMSYVEPFLVPMLENAGAYVMLPRERDTHSIEYVIDGDGGNAVGIYSEHNGHNHWHRGEEPGFAYKRDEYRVGENPFAEGSYRRVAATADASQWYIEPAEQIQFSMPSAGYNVRYYPFAVEIPESMQAFVVTSFEADADTVVAHVEQVSGVPAYTPFVVKGQRGTVTLPIVQSSEAALATPVKGMLARNTVQGINIFTWTTSGGKIGFRKRSTQVGYVSDNSAYLPYDGQANFVMLSPSELTGIESVLLRNAEAGAGQWFDLQGRAVAHPGRGIYINARGEKVMRR